MSKTVKNSVKYFISDLLKKSKKIKYNVDNVKNNKTKIQKTIIKKVK